MYMVLYTHTTGTQPIEAFTSPVVPRIGEEINVNSSAFRVVNVSYHIANQECNRIDIEVTPVNDAARQCIGEVLTTA